MTQKKTPAIYMTGTNMLSAVPPNFGQLPATLVFKTKRHFYFNFSSISNQFWHICGLLSTATFCKMWDSKHL